MLHDEKLRNYFIIGNQVLKCKLKMRNTAERFIHYFGHTNNANKQKSHSNVWYRMVCILIIFCGFGQHVHDIDLFREVFRSVILNKHSSVFAIHDLFSAHDLHNSCTDQAGNLISPSIVPWMSDAFELHPESGVATVLLGEASSILAFLVFLWSKRCCELIAGRPPDQQADCSSSGVGCSTIRLKSISHAAAGLAALTSVSMHGLVGFKVGGGAGVTRNIHRASAATFYVSTAACFWAITIVEWRAGLCPAPLTAVRFAVLLFSLAALVSCIALFDWGDCPPCRFTEVSQTGADPGSCLAVTLRPECADAARNPPAACAVAPALEVTAIGLLLLFLPTLALSLRGAAVAVTVPVTVADAATGSDEACDHSFSTAALSLQTVNLQLQAL